MEAASKSSGRARLFAALDLPEDVRRGVDEWGDRELADSALRRTAAESLHVTLVFLGSRPESEIDRLGEIVRSLEGPAPEIALGEVEQRPARGRARLYAIPVESPRLLELQEELSSRLVAAGLHEAEKRPFWPHVTVARVRLEGRGSRRPRRVEPPGPLPDAEWRTSVRAVRSSLYRSELKPEGARYARLTHVDLR